MAKDNTVGRYVSSDCGDERRERESEVGLGFFLMKDIIIIALFTRYDLSTLRCSLPDRNGEQMLQLDSGCILELHGFAVLYCYGKCCHEWV